MRRERFFSELTKGNQLVLALVGAFSRLEELTVGTRPTPSRWRTRLRRFHGPGQEEELWDAYFRPDRRRKQLRQGYEPHKKWGEFLLAWIRGNFHVAEGWKPDHVIEAKWQALATALSCANFDHDEYEYDPGDEEEDRREAGEKFLCHLDYLSLNSFAEFFPAYGNEMLPGVPGVGLLSADSIEMAVYQYKDVRPELGLGIFLVIREPRPKEFSGEGRQLYRDLIYLFASPEPGQVNETVGCYISSFEGDVFPLVSMANRNWLRVYRPSADLQAHGDRQTLDLFVHNITSWGDRDGAAGLLAGPTTEDENPGTWKILMSKPNSWNDLYDLETMLDLAGLKNYRKIDKTKSDDLIKQLGVTGLGVIGPFPDDPKLGDGMLYRDTRLEFAKLTTFVSEESKRSRADKLLKGVAFPIDSSKAVEFTREDLIDLIVKGWADLESTQYILKSSSKQVTDRVNERRLSERQNTLLFGRNQLLPGKAEMPEWQRLDVSDGEAVDRGEAHFPYDDTNT